MYYMLLNGKTTQEIADTLTDLGRETGLKKVCGRVNTIWSASSVATVMRNERYCGDVLTQLAAVEKAVKAISREIMQDHLETCVVEQVQAGNTEIVGEVMDLLRKFS